MPSATRRHSPLWPDRLWRPEQGTYVPNYGHPLCPNRAWFFDRQAHTSTFTDHEVITGYGYQTKTLGGAYSNRTTLGSSRRWGSGVQFVASGGGGGLNLGLETQVGLPTNGRMTIVAHKRKTDATNRDGVLFGVIDAAEPGSFAKRCGANVPFSDGTVYFDYGGVVAGTSRLSQGGLTFGDDVWAFSVGTRGMEIWQNGFLRNSNAGTPTRTAVTGGSFYLNDGQSAAGAGTTDLAVNCFLLLYWRQLSKHEIISLMFDPYQWCEPILRTPRTIPFAAAFKAAYAHANQRTGRHDR